jgi:hypothetical protein
MFAVQPTVIFLLILSIPSWAAAQVPPGEPYDPAKHPNPIITYVTTADFKTSNYQDAQDDAGIELLGLSQTEGQRESIVVAPGMTKKVRIANVNAEVTYYSVVRQTFKLNNGSELLLHSFKFPRIGLRDDIAWTILQQAAIEKKKDPKQMRFGGIDPPEEVDIRGREALLFDRDGLLIMYWQEDGVGHTASASLEQQEFFRILEDLL